MQLHSFEPEPSENAPRDYRLMVGSTVMVRADSRVLASLDATMREAVKRVPRPGVEVGGFLTGELHPWIRIDGFELLEIRHFFDPSLERSEAGLLMFRRALADRQKQVIGFFRSHTTGEPDPVEADNLIAKLFADLLDVSDPLLLLLPASASGLGEAQLYRRSEIEWVPSLRFALVPQAAGIGISEQPPAAVAPGAVAEPRSPPYARPRLKKKPLWLVAGGIVAAGTLAYFAGFSRQPTVISTPGGLGLAIAPAGSGLEVRWDRQSPDVVRAVSGSLMIQDGEQRPKVIPLSREQLRSGAAFYIAQTPRVVVRLDVYLDESHHRSENATSASGQLPEAKHEIHPEAPVPVPRRELRVPRKPIHPATARVVVPKPFAGVPVMAAPASSADRAGATLPAPPPVTQVLPQAVPELPASAPSPPAPPTPAPTAATRIGPPPINYVAPSAVRKVRPAIPANLRSAIQGMVSVEVKVAVDRTGKVVSAAPVTAFTPAQKLLAPEAVRAALLWQFEPARQNGVPVPSEAVLTFEFERPPR